jgi:transcription initiation factor IIF auxiliary subunit
MREPGLAWCRAGGLVGLLLLAGPLPASGQEISAKNTSRYVGDNRWDWTVYISASPTTLGEIRCVEYTLHPTFLRPHQRVCRPGNPKFPFGLRSNGWGTFEIPIKVTFKRGETRLLKHLLVFETPPVQQNLPITTGNTAKQLRPGWWNWTVFIQGPAEVLDQVNCVEYTLHSSFASPVREVCSRGTGPAFALSESGWGTFQILVRVLLKDGRVQKLAHSLQFK